MNYLKDFIHSDAVYIVAYIFTGILVFVIFLLISGIIVYIVKYRLKRYNIDNDFYQNKSADIIGSIIFFVLAFLSLALTISLFKVNISIVFAGLGFGIGYFMKDFLGNMFSGVMIMNTKIIKIGDLIRLETDGHFGRIEDINPRYCVLRDINKRRIIVYNSYISQVPIKTFSCEEIIRRELYICVNYNEDLDAIISIIKNIINDIEYIKEKESTEVLLESFEERGIGLRIYYYISPKSGVGALKIDSNIRKKILSMLEQNGYELSYPKSSITSENYNNNSILKFINQNKIF